MNISQNALACLKIQHILLNLTKTSDSLDIIERRLEDYLELKRQSFPRFYFLSNDDLLEILANSSDHDLIQRHFPKLFENLNKLILKEDSLNTILSMVSSEGEVVSFNKPTL